ncbi:hypothetical protein EDB83DRAFT_2629986 [Lactarius deliciosus]|nr:hypothetical protein EDB83DRAFT_2629986 [Lactarius deliciosus]
MPPHMLTLAQTWGKALSPTPLLGLPWPIAMEGGSRSAWAQSGGARPSSISRAAPPGVPLWCGALRPFFTHASRLFVCGHRLFTRAPLPVHVWPPPVRTWPPPVHTCPPPGIPSAKERLCEGGAPPPVYVEPPAPPQPCILREGGCAPHPPFVRAPVCTPPFTLCTPSFVVTPEMGAPLRVCTKTGVGGEVGGASGVVPHSCEQEWRRGQKGGAARMGPHSRAGGNGNGRGEGAREGPGGGQSGRCKGGGAGVAVGRRGEGTWKGGCKGGAGAGDAEGGGVVEGGAQEEGIVCRNTQTHC